MVKKKTEKYLPKPDLKKVKRAVASGKVSSFKKEIIKEAYEKQKAYTKQQERIKAGLKPSKAKAVVQAAAKRFMSKPILKRPTTSLPSYSPTKFVAQLAQSQGSLVHEIQNRYADPPQDNRSQFFRESFKEEKRKAFGGFL